MIDRLANRYGLPIRETPVGFNHIAEIMLKEDVLIGGEELGGISIKGHIPEGDGVLMGLLLVEIISSSGKTLYNLVENLLKEVGPAFYQRTDLRLNHPVAKEKMQQYLLDNSPSKIGDVPIQQIYTMDGVKYLLKDDSWLLIRPSGTEPVLRVYAEGRNQEIMQALISYGEKIAASVT